jgi:hypothetical protein
MKASINVINASKEKSKSTRDKMKEFERFLKYAGVDHLPQEKKKIYKFDSERKAEAVKVKKFEQKR